MAQYRSDVKNSDSIEAAKHFQKPGHSFQEHSKFTIIDRIEKEMEPNALRILRIFMEQI